jgi:hypothetical protein
MLTSRDSSYKNAPLSVWRAPLAIGGLPCLIVLLWVPFIPESPRYLLLKNQTDKAWEIVKNLHSTKEDVDHTYARGEFHQMRTQLAIDRTLKSGYIEMFRRPSYRKRVFMGMGLTFALQSSGVLVINSKSCASLSKLMKLNQTRLWNTLIQRLRI